MAPPLFVVLEGNIGAGKTTLLRAILAEAAAAPDGTWPGVRVVEEPVSDWTERVLPGGESLLGAFYADPDRHALGFQMAVLLSRARTSDAVAAAEAAEGGQVVIWERSIASSTELFVAPMWQSGRLSDLEWHVYRGWEARVRAACEPNPPDAVVYLRATPEISAARIAARARTGEAGRVPPDLLRSLHERHDAWVMPLMNLGDGGGALLVLDALEDVHSLARRVLLFCVKRMEAKGRT